MGRSKTLVRLSTLEDKDKPTLVSIPCTMGGEESLIFTPSDICFNSHREGQGKMKKAKNQDRRIKCAVSPKPYGATP